MHSPKFLLLVIFISLQSSPYNIVGHTTIGISLILREYYVSIIAGKVSGYAVVSQISTPIIILLWVFKHNSQFWPTWAGDIYYIHLCRSWYAD